MGLRLSRRKALGLMLGSRVCSAHDVTAAENTMDDDRKRIEDRYAELVRRGGEGVNTLAVSTLAEYAAESGKGAVAVLSVDTVLQMLYACAEERRAADMCRYLVDRCRTMYRKLLQTGIGRMTKSPRIVKLVTGDVELSKSLYMDMFMNLFELYLTMLGKCLGSLHEGVVDLVVKMATWVGATIKDTEKFARGVLNIVIGETEGRMRLNVVLPMTFVHGVVRSVCGSARSARKFHSSREHMAYLVVEMLVHARSLNRMYMSEVVVRAMRNIRRITTCASSDNATGIG